MRTSRTNRIGLTDRQAHLFFRLAGKNTYRSVDDIERILRFRVVMPRYRLGRTDLHLDDPETGPSSVIGATFNFIRPACGVQRLHVNSLQFCAICGGQPHSDLILASRITLPHFSVSSAMSLPKSAGEPPSAVPSRWASRALNAGSASAALISLLSLSMISVGVFLGAPRPKTELAS